MRKQIRLTESQLHDFITKAVKRVISEGKYTNNVPRFEAANGMPYKKGEYAPGTAIDKKYGVSNWSLFRNALKNGGDDWDKSKESTEAWSKHNDRAWSEFDDKLALKKKGEVLRMQDNKREWIDFFSKRGLKPEDIENMEPEEEGALIGAYLGDAYKIRNAVKESIKRVINESPVWSDMDSELETELNALGAAISRFYSDDGVLVVRLKNRDNKNSVRDAVESRGYKLYDAGYDGASIMLTFNRK